MEARRSVQCMQITSNGTAHVEAANTLRRFCLHLYLAHSIRGVCGIAEEDEYEPSIQHRGVNESSTVQLRKGLLQMHPERPNHTNDRTRRVTIDGRHCCCWCGRSE